MQVAIIEDNAFHAETLQNYLKRFSEETSTMITSQHYSDGKEFLNQFQPTWDLILLDIEMPCMNGIEVAKEIRKQDEEVIIIFITQMAKYAIEGYAVRAFDYILKPVNYYAFTMKMKHVIRMCEQKKQSFFVISNQSGKIKQDLDYLRSGEVQNHTLLYHTTETCIFSTSYSSLGKLAEELIPKGFARNHNSYLVNLRYITGYEKNNVILGEECLPLSRTYYKSFIQSLLKYWGGKQI